MLICRIYLLFAILFSLPLSVFAQKEIVKFNHVGINPIQQEKILCLHQDKKGYMWIGSFDGLHRYNSFEIKTYLPVENDTLSISGRVVNAIAESSNGFLYIATDKGLNEFDPITETFRKIDLPSNGANSASPQYIKSLHIGKQGTIWIGTFGEGLFSYNQSSKIFKQYKHIPSNSATIQSNLINAIFESDNGDIYIGTESGGFSTLTPNTQSLHSYIFELELNSAGADNTVNNFYEDKDGVWVGTWNSGLKLFDNHKKTVTDPLMTPETKQLLAKASIRDIAPSGTDQLWLATFYNGLVLYNKKDGTATVFKQEDHSYANGLNSQSIYSLLTDRENNLWIGTFGNGLYLYDLAKHTIPHFKASTKSIHRLSSNDICSIEEQKDYLWFGTNGKGLNKFNTRTKTVETFLSNGNEREQLVRVIEVDNHNRLWAGTDNGLYIYNAQVNDMIPINQVSGESKKLTHDPVYGIAQDIRGNIWIGFHGDGLYKISQNQLDVEHPDQWLMEKAHQTKSGEAIPNGTVMLLESVGDDIWATINNYLIRYNVKNGSLQTFQNEGFSCLHQTPEGDLWFGTYTNGIAKFDTENTHFNFIDHKQYLPSSMITGIQSDTLGNLWIYSYTGICKYNPKNKTGELYSKENGLQENYIQPNAYTTLPNGDLIVAGKNGYNIINPSRIKKLESQPEITLSDFKVFNKSVTIDKGKPNDRLYNISINHLDTIELEYRQNVLTFEFATLNYRKSKNILIAYQLEGFDDKFTVIKDQNRSITYTNLDPGTYKLHYKCCNTNGTWLKTAQSRILIIHPPFWMTWWFKSLVSLVIALLLVLAYRARIMRIKNQFKLDQAEKEKQIAKLKMNSLQKTLEHKTTELASATMSIVKRNNAIHHIQNRIKELTSRLPASHQGQFKLYLKQLNREKGEEMSWDEFVRNFDAVHNDFIKRFSETYPKLTQKDLRTSAYLRMNLTNEDIASLQNITLRAVETARYRIRQKIELQSKDTLSEFVCKF